MITGINLYPNSVPDNPSILPFSSKRQFEVQVEISFFDIFIVVKENTADYCECHFRFKLFLARKKITIVDFTRVFIINMKESVFGQPEGFHVSFFFFNNLSRWTSCFLFESDRFWLGNENNRKVRFLWLNVKRSDL